MEIRVLKYFLAVAREGNITTAANSLHLTQPTLSRQLQELERELNQKLLIRGKSKVTLTPEGLILKKRAQEIVQLVEKTQSELAFSKEISGDIYIGGGETDSIKYIAEIIKELQEEYKGIKFHIYSGNAEDVTEKLERGLLDFGLLIQPIDLDKYEHISLPDRDIWGVLMRKDSPLAKQKTIKVNDLIDIPILASRQMTPKYLNKSDFLEWFEEKYEQLNIKATYNLIYNASVMVKAGIGVAVTLDKLADTSDESELCFRPLEPKLTSGLDIAWKKGQVFSPAAKLFLRKMKERF